MEPYKTKRAVVPGTFDPLTMGHVGLVRRGLTLFDEIIVAVARDTPKVPLFSLKERVAMTEEVFKDDPNVRVEGFEGLLAAYVESRRACAVLRGLRAVSDFEYEFQMALMNRRLNKSFQTIFLMTDYRWLYISSTIIKEAAKAGGDVKGLVPENVYGPLYDKFRAQKND